MIAKLKKKGAEYWSNGKVKQILMLFSVNIASIPIGIVTSVVLSHYLGANGYGDYQFMDNLFNFSVLIIVIGFFQAANRALVLSQNKEKSREYFGATLILLIGLFVLLSIGLGIYAIFDTNLREKHLVNLLIYTIPFGWVYLLLQYFENLFQADNRMKLLALARLLPRIGFLIAAILIYAFFMKSKGDHLLIAWGFYIGMQAIPYLYVVFRIGLKFTDLRKNIIEIWNYNKSYGLHVYIGSAFSVGVALLTGVLISYFGKTNTGVGYYSLSLSLASPLQFIPNTIATTNYKEFAFQPSVPKKLTQLTLGLTIASLIGMWVIVPPFIHFFYGKKFEPVIYINFIVSFGIAAYGMADYYNRYLGARGHGKLLRNTSFIVGTLILGFNYLLIPKFGAVGAAYTRLIGGVGYLACMLYYYRKTVSAKKKEAVPELVAEL